jgi:translation elongation factor EF-4
MGVNVEHKIADFMVGATYIKMSERPYTEAAHEKRTKTPTTFVTVYPVKQSEN